jgi:DNA-binding MarR family transcriptional regulator
MSAPPVAQVAHLEALFPPIMHLFHNLAGQVSRLGDFSLAQYRVLMLVYHHGPMSITSLCRQASSAQSSASELVDRMVKQSLLQRDKDPKDKRVTLFSLTPKGRKLIEQRKKNMRLVYQRLLNPLNESQREELIEAFATVLRLTRQQISDTLSIPAEGQS